MNDAPLSRPYNLGRLGQTGDEVVVDADAAERAALVKAAGVLEVPKLQRACQVLTAALAAYPERLKR